MAKQSYDVTVVVVEQFRVRVKAADAAEARRIASASRPNNARKTVACDHTRTEAVDAVATADERFPVWTMPAGPWRGTSITPSRAAAAPPPGGQAQKPQAPARPRAPRRVVVGHCSECGADYYDDGTVRHARGCGG